MQGNIVALFGPQRKRILFIFLKTWKNNVLTVTLWSKESAVYSFALELWDRKLKQPSLPKAFSGEDGNLLRQSVKGTIYNRIENIKEFIIDQNSQRKYRQRRKILVLPGERKLTRVWDESPREKDI